MVVGILSRSNSYKEREDGESLVRREDIEESLNVQRILKLLAIVLVFLVAASILFSILFCVASKIKEEEELVLMLFDDTVCAEKDDDCIANLCPVGMTWHPERNQCSERGVELAPFLHHGVDPAMCPRGYLWVPWRQRCMRSTESLVEGSELEE